VERGQGQERGRLVGEPDFRAVGQGKGAGSSRLSRGGGGAAAAEVSQPPSWLTLVLSQLQAGALEDRGGL
jgi:hypothetical protein